MDAFPITLTILPAATGQPLANLARTVLGTTAAEPVLEHGGVWLNRQRVLDTTRPAPLGAELTFHRPPHGRYSVVTISPEDIIYEDRWLLAINKRAGWYIKATPWDIQGNVAAALDHFLQQRDGEAPSLHLLRQLDRDTSGVVLCTKSRYVNAPLQEAFVSRRIHKTYLCVCAGEPAEETFEIHSGHGRMRSGRWCLYPLDQVGAVLPNGKHVRQTHTSFFVERRMGDATLLRAVPHTGRTHQIRLHLASIGHPLVGDRSYGGPDTLGGQPVAYHMLHAARLCLEHPITGAWLELETPLPGHIAAVVT